MEILASLFTGGVFWIFRKTGLFFRYAVYYIIGEKKTLKYLDRIQWKPNWFSQRGINTFIGAVIIITIITLLFKFL